MLTSSLPEIALAPDQPPLAAHVVALEEVQVRVETLPTSTCKFDADIETVGAGGAEPPPPPPQETIKIKLKIIENLFINLLTIDLIYFILSLSHKESFKKN
tara:strand:- start:14 stop:316 length:303 start_codon:yes stop_codon:yes gene_type:complete